MLPPFAASTLSGGKGYGAGVPKASARKATTIRVMSRRRFLLSLAPALVAPAWVARAWATTIPRASAVPGGVAKVGLGASEQPPRVRLGSDRVLVMREGGEWV